MYLSVSKVDCYRNCPRLYYYRYVKKPIEVENKHFVIGNITHKILELYHQQYIDNQDVLKSLQYSLQNGLVTEYTKKYLDNKIIKKSDIKMISGLIKKYISKYGKNPNVITCEKQFKINLARDVQVFGKIDRIDKENNCIKIVDYKTSKDIESLNYYLDTSVQLQTYGLWARDVYKDTSLICEYIFLKHIPNGNIDFIVTDKMLEDCRNIYIEIANKIDDKCFEKNKKFQWCKTCEYTKFCEVEENV